MKYAIISDIHGNYMALQHIINDATHRGVDGYILVGDYCISAPWPGKVVGTIRSLQNAHIIRGNEENYFEKVKQDDGQFAITGWCRKQLTDDQLQWLKNLPEEECFSDGDFRIHVAHNSKGFIGDAEIGHFHSGIIMDKYAGRRVTREELLSDINDILEKDEAFKQVEQSLPKGIYIFGHTHVQWYRQTKDHVFINPGSCGNPLDCNRFGAPYTILNIEGDSVTVEERRVDYDVYALIDGVKSSTQFQEAEVWSRMVFREWLHVRNEINGFLRFAEGFARRIGDSRRPLVKDTWQAAYYEWIQKRVDKTQIIR